MIFKAVVRAVIVTALIAIAPTLVPHRGLDPDAVRQQSGNTVLYDHRSECWVGIEPAHVDMPTHVIMRVENGVNADWRYLGKRWVDIALNDVFTHDNPHVIVLAFCE